jgi:hypothetical protein
MKRYELVAVAAMILGLGRIADAAGTGSVEGTVVDQMSGQVVPGSKVIVWVVCGSQRHGAAVDEDTTDQEIAYARFGDPVPAAYDGWLD